MIGTRYSILTVGVVSDGLVAGHLVQRGNIEWDQLRFWAGDVFGQVSRRDIGSIVHWTVTRARLPGYMCTH